MVKEEGRKIYFPALICHSAAASFLISSIIFEYKSSPSLPVTFTLSTTAIGCSRQLPHCFTHFLIFIFRSGNSSSSRRNTFPLPLLFSQKRIFIVIRYTASGEPTGATKTRCPISPSIIRMPCPLSPTSLSLAIRSRSLFSSSICSVTNHCRKIWVA